MEEFYDILCLKEGMIVNMKALRKIKNEAGAEFQDIPIPKIGPTDLLVKVKATALCKSDIDVYNWTPVVQNLKLPLPITMGHEFLGEVVDIGEVVKGFSIGDHVVGETHVPCGYCYACKTGKSHICVNNMGVLGRSIDGSFAEFIRLPSISAIKVDNSMPPSHGAIMEPLATAIHATTKADVAGKTVAILGCGAIGLMNIEIAKILGATRVIAISRTQAKLDKARELGADLVINNKNNDMVEAVMENTHGIGVDVIIDYTGDINVINDSVDMLKVGGKCVYVGMIDYPLTFEKFMVRVVYKELVLTGIFGREIYSTWEVLNNILESNRMNLKNYIADEVPLSDISKWIDKASKLTGRVILYPDFN